MNSNKYLIYRAFFLVFCLSWFSMTTMADEENVTTRYIKNPSFESGFTNWTQANMQTQTNSDFPFKAGGTYVEKWVSGSNAGNASVVQALTNLPAGTYKLKAGAQNLLQSNKTAPQSGAYIFAGDDRTTVTSPAEYELEFTTLGGTIDIGFRAANATGNWLAVDNFRLFFLGIDASTLYPKLVTLIEQAEKTLLLSMQPKFKNELEAAINAAKEITAESSAEEIASASEQLSKARAAAIANNVAYSALRTAMSRAKTLLGKQMTAKAKADLQAAYDAASAIIDGNSDDDISVVAGQLDEAYTNATANSTIYTSLQSSIRTANNLNKKDKEGVEELEEAIAAAQAVLDNESATIEEMSMAKSALDRAVLIFRMANATGTEPTVKTLSVIQGATIMFGRASFPSNMSETGFCWSENPEPTVLDYRTTTYYANNGNIYYMNNIKPSTVYYVRAYAISRGYKVGYGAQIKVATLPKGTISWSYDNAGDDATNTRIRNAITDAVNTWNSVSAIHGFSTSVHYSPGTPTADCSYGGWMRVGANSSYQRTGTIMHEMAHGIGVGTQNNWWSATYRANTSSGKWLGARVDRVVQFLENSSTAYLNGDNTHMWPYGINGAHEDTGARMLYYGNGLIVEALGEDNLPPTSGAFATPAYTFMQDDNVKYYIKNENPNRGLSDSYLRETASSRLSWVQMNCDDAFLNDSCAWYITYNPVTCYYTIKNAATEKCMTYYGSGNNGIRLSASATSNSYWQLMPSRNTTKVGSFTFAGTAYWILSSQNHMALSASTNKNVASQSFSHVNSATDQRWLLLTADEVAQFAAANGESTGIKDVAENNVVKGLNLKSGKGFVSISAVGGGQHVNINSIDGRRVMRIYMQVDATTEVSLPRGVYLINGQKVLVR